MNNGVTVNDIKTVEEFGRQYQSHYRHVFRGQSDSRWKLETTLERAALRLNESGVELERHILREFQRQAPNYLSRLPERDDALEWLSLIRHYGSPCRLLDFSHSFWIALFFAMESANSNFSVFVVNLLPLDKLKDGICRVDIAGNEVRGVCDMNSFLRDSMHGEQGEEFKKVYSDEPFYINERFASQQGHVLFSGSADTSFEKALENSGRAGEDVLVDRIDIDFGLRRDVAHLLEKMNISHRTLMPGLEGFAKSFWNPWIPKSMI